MRHFLVLYFLIILEPATPTLELVQIPDASGVIALTFNNASFNYCFNDLFN